ncbi:hypothetical protein IV203_007581 [Nitzschia inconspicua]|uniref:Uncharacterized protein n=1 Tax=Nitzschia inconspicua TaxID=303405 RepID=A0A9K3KF57_9STRA|nr:hypothetical protein IV203_007581 [Nitzschia inconspicua]
MFLHGIWKFLSNLDCQTLSGTIDREDEENSISNTDVLFYDGTKAVRKKKSTRPRRCLIAFRRIFKACYNETTASRLTNLDPPKQQCSTVGYSARTIDTTHNSSFGSYMTDDAPILSLATVWEEEESKRSESLTVPRLASIVSHRTIESSVMDMTDHPEERSNVHAGLPMEDGYQMSAASTTSWTTVSSMTSLYSHPYEEERISIDDLDENTPPAHTTKPNDDRIRFGDFDIDEGYSTTSSSIFLSDYLSSSYLTPQNCSSAPRLALLKQQSSNAWNSTSSLSTIGSTDSSAISSITMLSREKREHRLESTIPGRIHMTTIRRSHSITTANKIASKICKLRQRISKNRVLPDVEDDSLSMRGVMTYVGGSMNPSKCLILLMDPRKRKYDIVNVNFEPGCRVCDLIDQIPLQNSSNFGLRFQRYIGLVHGDLTLYSKEPLNIFSNLDSAMPEYYCLCHQEQEAPLIAIPDGYLPAQAHALARIVFSSSSSSSPKPSLSAYQAFQEMQDYLLSGLEF